MQYAIRKTKIQNIERERETIGEVVLGERVSLIGWRLSHEDRLILAIDNSAGSGGRGTLKLLVQGLVDPVLPIGGWTHLGPGGTQPSLSIHVSSFLHQSTSCFLSLFSLSILF